MTTTTNMSSHTYPLILVEVPHQFPPKCYTVENEAALIALADTAAERCGNLTAAEYLDIGSERTASDALRYLGDDLHALDVWQVTDMTTLTRQLAHRRHGDPSRTNRAVEKAIELGWIGERVACADCAREGVVCANANGEIEVGGVLFDAPRLALVLAGSKHNGDPVCDTCECERDEAAAGGVA